MKKLGPPGHKARDVLEVPGNKCKATCWVNLAATRLKLGEPAAAIHCCKEALDVDPCHGKAFLRRGQAKLAQGNVDDARSDLLDALKREPKSREVRMALEDASHMRTPAASYYGSFLLWQLPKLAGAQGARGAQGAEGGDEGAARLGVWRALQAERGAALEVCTALKSGPS